MMIPDEPIAADQFSKLAEARSKIYGLLSSIYLKSPDRDFVKILMDKNFNVRLASLAREIDLPKEMREGVKIIEGFTESSKTTSPEELHNSLAVEHARLFRGVKRNYGPPPPYESVHVEKGLVMGESTAEVQKKYAEAGVSLSSDLKGEPPDYIGLELEFMRYLCSEETGAWRDGHRDAASKYLEMENRFLREHLVRWIPRFCDIVADEAKLDFYLGVAKITKGFLVFEQERMDALIEAARIVKQ